MKDFCSHCGRTFAEIAKTGFVGCEHCYREIDKLTQRVRQLFGGNVHTGHVTREKP